MAYAIKVRKHGERVWQFLNGRGGTNPLRIHASQWAEAVECERYAVSVADEIKSEYDIKVVTLGNSTNDYKLITECAPIKREVKPPFEILEGPGCCQEAARRARVGHKPWITWIGRDDVPRAARKSAASLKMALLALGTQGRWVLYDGDSCGMIMYWGNGIDHIRRCNRGYRF